MGKNNNSKFSFKGDIIGGEFLTRETITKQWPIIIYVFILTLGVMTVSHGVENTQLQLRRNQYIIKNLKADYTSKAAKLQYLSKRDEVTERLKAQESRIAPPTHPPILIKILISDID